jgi:hypothetical protein
MSFHQNRQGLGAGRKGSRLVSGGPLGERAVVSTFRRDFAVDLLQVQR